MSQENVEIVKRGWERYAVVCTVRAAATLAGRLI